MSIQPKSLILGFILGCITPVVVFFGLYYLDSAGSQPVVRDQLLASGERVKVTSFHLVWGIEHDERRTGDDQFALEYVSAFATGDEPGREPELLNVFELIRPASELWGFGKATVSAFPTTERKGKYDIYAFTRSPGGAWTFTRTPAKVFVND